MRAERSSPNSKPNSPRVLRIVCSITPSTSCGWKAKTYEEPRRLSVRPYSRAYSIPIPLEPPVLYSEHHEGNGQELFEAATRLNYEGIVSKKADAPYRSDRI
jgi:hypothetical protein